jgi:RNA recognition motif-containing protein
MLTFHQVTKMATVRPPPGIETGREPTEEKPVGLKAQDREVHDERDLLALGMTSCTLFANLFSEDRPKDDAEVNPGSNLFVSGIAPRMLEDELEELFSKYGQVDKVQIMVDPHTRESRGFGFVQMHTAEDADAAKDALTGEEKYGRVLTIEKARRGRARTPTPGKYFGPPKRNTPI